MAVSRQKARDRTREIGQGLVEYAMVLLFVAIVLIALLALFGPVVNRNLFTVMCRVHDGRGTMDVDTTPGVMICYDRDGTEVGTYSMDGNQYTWNP